MNGSGALALRKVTEGLLPADQSKDLSVPDIRMVRSRVLWEVSSRARIKGMIQLGVAITFLTLAVLVVEFIRCRRAALPAYGWAGLAGLLMAEWLLVHGFSPVSIYF